MINRGILVYLTGFAKRLNKKCVVYALRKLSFIHRSKLFFVDAKWRNYGSQLSMYRFIMMFQLPLKKISVYNLKCLELFLTKYNTLSMPYIAPAYLLVQSFPIFNHCRLIRQYIHFFSFLIIVMLMLVF